MTKEENPPAPGVLSKVRGSMRLVLIGAVVVLVALAYVGNTLWFGEKEQSVTRLDPAQVIVVRTPGGMLEVATLIRNEEFGWSVQYTCPLIDCSRFLKPTISRVRVPVHYTYRVRLSATWELRRVGNLYELTVPQMEPEVPVAFDTRRIEIETKKGWLSPREGPNVAALIRHLGPELEIRAKQAHYISLQQEEASKTIAEFAQKWMREQMKTAEQPIKVTFQ